MKDFNFFEPYLKNEVLSRNKRIAITVLAIIVTFVMLIVHITNSININNQEKEIAILENMMNSKNAKEAIKELSSEEKEYDILEEYYKRVAVIKGNIISKDRINNELLDNILSTIPQKVYFNTMSMNGKGIQIQGYADSRISIAELEHNLKSLKIFSKVYIPAISTNEKEDKFIFSITCALKDVNSNENEKQQ
ncbi:fimbrial assembly protein (PilN) [Clostridium tepidiprofundi DSM 19306]|uniref:Fimbrial assembly protein (PilN) n=1 Tax=Clostridium tepidiprofundi DSM 19306 TaxID=1121338 RepID=A0A151B603_9CLOT|nr:PilN domain-containing protein [Clostridium tepidiprofundi]KYH35326.1 fimbrial assembly protein (PilN) [Clostridium tepidiprofundi DSM 19306]